MLPGGGSGQSICQGSGQGSNDCGCSLPGALTMQLQQNLPLRGQQLSCQFFAASDWTQPRPRKDAGDAAAELRPVAC